MILDHAAHQVYETTSSIDAQRNQGFKNYITIH